MTEKRPPHISVENVSKVFAGNAALNDVSLEIYQGEVLCLLGDNGAGKSTLIKVLSGFHQPSSGIIRIEGREQPIKSPRDAADLGISTVHQFGGTFPLMSLERSFFVGLEPTKGWGPFKYFDRKTAGEIVVREMQAMGINRVTDGSRLVGSLSGGERQVSAIARAVYFGAKVLILDEPTAALGVKEAAHVLRIIMQAKNRGLAVVLVTHNVTHAMTVGDHFAILIRGIKADDFDKWDEAGMRYLAEGAKKLRENTDRAIVGIYGGSIFEVGQMFFRNDNWYMALATEPDLIHRFLDKLVGIHMKRIDMFLDAVGPYIDIYLSSDDYGMQTGPQISPAMFREFFKPRHKMMWDLVKSKKPDIKVKMHSCGSINALLPDLIDAGLDAVNPVQTNCKLMEPERLKSQFKDQITFWGGGCNTQQILPKGTPAEVRDNVFSNLDILFPGGGFVFQQIHNIQADVPPENIVAMFDAVAEWNEKNT